jgi:hypothetical protein
VFVLGPTTVAATGAVPSALPGFEGWISCPRFILARLILLSAAMEEAARVSKRSTRWILYCWKELKHFHNLWISSITDDVTHVITLVGSWH